MKNDLILKLKYYVKQYHLQDILRIGIWYLLIVNAYIMGQNNHDNISDLVESMCGNKNVNWSIDPTGTVLIMTNLPQNELNFSKNTENVIQKKALFDAKMSDFDQKNSVFEKRVFDNNFIPTSSCSGEISCQL